MASSLLGRVCSRSSSQGVHSIPQCYQNSTRNLKSLLYHQCSELFDSLPISWDEPAGVSQSTAYTASVTQRRVRARDRKQQDESDIVVQSRRVQLEERKKIAKTGTASKSEIAANVSVCPGFLIS